MNIKGKVVIVTGASSGIGEATARQFGREGAKVVLVDVDDAGIRRNNTEVTEGSLAPFQELVPLPVPLELHLCVVAESVGRSKPIDLD